MKKITILGGGASGILAAILLAKKLGSENVMVIEGGDRILKKLALSGNGQCNISNVNISAENYYGDTEFIQNALNRFPASKTLELFKELGIETVVEPDGRVYPRSYQASSCVDIFRLQCQKMGIEICLGEIVNSITKCGDVFEIRTSGKDYTTTHIIYALGGATYPKLLTNSTNFKFLSGLSHTITPLLPALVQLKAKNSTLKLLKGIKTDVELSLIVTNKIVAKTFGELHFGDNTLSGPATFTISPKASLLFNDNVSVDASIDFFSEYDSGELLEFFCERAENLRDLPIDNFFSTLVHNQIGRAILKECELNPQDIISTLTDDDLIKIMKTSKNYRVKLLGTNGTSFAQVSLGGVPTTELTENLESKLVPKLYIIGESCDVTGVCGGYNLQWAWTSAQIVSAALSN